MSIIINPTTSNSKCFLLIDKDLLINKLGNEPSFDDLLELKKKYASADFFEEREFGLCVLGLDSNVKIPDKFTRIPIRQYFSEHDETSNFLLSRARSILVWRKENHYCSCCGTKLTDHFSLTAKVCMNCTKMVFPRIEPCVIILLQKDEQILLVRHTQRNQNVFTCIAGFIEAGESAEEAVRREIQEEVGLKVKNIRYRGSQSWPFPDQLMLAFTAEYESGEIILQKDEISEAHWFNHDDCPSTPAPGSIAYKLIHNEI